METLTARGAPHDRLDARHAPEGAVGPAIGEDDGVVDRSRSPLGDTDAYLEVYGGAIPHSDGRGAGPEGSRHDGETAREETGADENTQ